MHEKSVPDFLVTKLLTTHKYRLQEAEASLRDETIPEHVFLHPSFMHTTPILPFAHSLLAKILWYFDFIIIYPCSCHCNYLDIIFQ